jgi:Dimerisation and cyclophilin-binding domain of Mon2
VTIHQYTCQRVLLLLKVLLMHGGVLYNALSLQTLVMVVTWRSCEMSEETISQALTVCLSLHEAKNATVRHAAYMTIRQIIR